MTDIDTAIRERIKLDCDICGRPAKGVASSTLGAFSYAICQDCLTNNAEPEDILRGVVEDCGGDVCDWVKELMIYRDGKYVLLTDTDWFAALTGEGEK